MNVPEQIKEHIASLPEPKRSDMQQLHQLILHVQPGSKLWFDNGVDSEGKTVTNPTIGYGSFTMKYAGGKTKEVFQIGVAATTTGLSVYILGIKDKKYLAETFGKKLGKTSVTGYCIKFKTVKDVHIDVLEEVIRYGFEAQKEQVK